MTASIASRSRSRCAPSGQQGPRRPDHPRHHHRHRRGRAHHDRRQRAAEQVPRELLRRGHGRPLRIAHALGGHERLLLYSAIAPTSSFGRPASWSASCGEGPSSTRPSNGGRDLKYRSETMERRETSSAPRTSRPGCPAPSRRPAGSSCRSTSLYKRNVCVIGTDVRDGLFGTADPINKTLQIGRTEVPGHRRDGEAGRELPGRSELRPAGLRPHHARS